MTRGTAPRVLPPETVVVLAPGSGDPLGSDQVAGPACLCPGAEGGPVDGLEAGAGACLWFIRWADQAELAVCLEVGDVPVFTELRQTLQRLITTRLEAMPAANQLPA